MLNLAADPAKPLELSFCQGVSSSFYHFRWGFVDKVGIAQPPESDFASASTLLRLFSSFARAATSTTPARGISTCTVPMTPASRVLFPYQEN